jgi:hypothetical protein
MQHYNPVEPHVERGYRPRGGEQHATVVAYAEESLGPSFSDQIGLLDQMRRKRHRIIYDLSGMVGEDEAEQAIIFARMFSENIRTIITGQIKLDL